MTRPSPTTTTSARDRPIQRVLVANRGEIASRVFRTCRALGKDAVAVYSDADRTMPFVHDALQAVALGPAPATESYLNMSKVIDAAKKAGADAIHPGYGFLSENQEFAQAVLDAGLTWIGPDPESIAAIGDKRRAKELLSQHPQIALVPGYHGANQDVAFLVVKAREIGFPLLLKASAGGGGKGMRVVRDESTLLKDIEMAKGEGLRSFGSDELLMERYFEHIKHIEVQIMGDRHGNVISLGTRDCSLQRRHQKVIEEAPAPAKYRAAPPGRHAATAHLPSLTMEEAAVQIGQAIKFVGAGTVEFLVDMAGCWYFLEVNTRLQVEHCVTEQITGLDLVALQIWVAEGQALPTLLPPTPAVAPPPLHSIECRLYAEDPDNEFAPSTGTILQWSAPTSTTTFATSAGTQVPAIRVESALATGSSVTVFYDAMVCKLIATAPSRVAAIAAMRRVLLDTVCLGVRTNRAFLARLLDDPAFVSEMHSTRTIAEILAREPNAGKDDAAVIVSAVAATCWHALAMQHARSAWRCVPSNWSNMPSHAPPKAAWIDLRSKTRIEVTYRRRDGAVDTWEMVVTFGVQPAREPVTVDVHHVDWPHTLAVAIDGVMQMVHLARAVEPPRLPRRGNDEMVLHVQPGAMWETVPLQKVSRLWSKAQSAEESDTDYKSLMPCRVLKIHVGHDQLVQKGDLLLVIESMKMEMRIVAKQAGHVTVHVKEGALTEAGVLLAQIKPVPTE
ncbi:hypothetical protein AMAG_02715 [Allomyces macrogynus ATCC 38327]|uniref:Acetyl-CoA carboxylase, biotin carboxylase subunit n=1 Tax=Allomyces macrogynus (strain ATCC 38327) TaxID=578462 RepID=A0A0L0S333_ALLM3|nr:hypothetical protein AMAG_02715 [Allomyces macrogynus ATCC 38327]|eukprot:KNE56948.1 hypothetical protein AMAG_02715 [Allomyces macrogynus ATCC 38327]